MTDSAVPSSSPAVLVPDDAAATVGLGVVASPAAGSQEELPIKMLFDRLLVDPEKDSSERHSAEGLVIPVTAQGPKRLAWAVVRAKGENVRQVDVGDRVLFDPEDRAEVEFGGTDYVLLRERDLHGVRKKPDAGSTGLYL